MQVFSSNAKFESNIGDVKEYTLGDPRVICRILSDNLYSNKIGSIVRELSANALDAHRMLGKENVPFEVCLPGLDGLFRKDESVFSIRDFGPGLNEDDIYALYTSYGSSSKRSDNSQIGGFGIGSKSPFAYADMFTVTSWNGGIMMKYLCFLNKEGSPCIKKLAEELSSEQSGMKVEIAVGNSEDAEIFRKECEFQYSFYDVPPVGGSWSRLNPDYQNEYGRIYSSGKMNFRCGPFSGWRNNSILYGYANNSIYKLNWSSSGNSTPVYEMEDGRIGYNVLPFQNAMCVLDIPGQLIDLSASREEMAFTERTKEAIKETWKKFIVKAWNEIIDDINENADASRFEAIWKWKSKGLSFSALKNWITSGNGKVDYLCDENFNLNLNYVFPVFPIDCSIIREFLDGGIRGYEGVRSSAGNPMLAKIGKLSKDLNCSTNHWNLNVKNVFEYSNESKKIWSLSLSEGEDFKLVFLNKDATFASMKDLAKDILTASPHCIIHFYALDGKEERRKVIAAYGNPRTDHVMEVVLKRKEKTSIDVQDIQEKKEKVKVRINPSAFMNKGHIYSAEATEILSWIRANLKEKWVDIEEIEQFASSGGILLVTSGTELSEKWNLKQKMILETVARLSCHKENIPKKWMLLNEASYSKLLSLGFKPLDSNYSRQTVRKMIENLEIDWKDFEAWLMLSKFESELKLTVLDNAFGFENNILPDHKDSAYSKAYIVWKRVKSIIESKGSRTNRFASMAFDESYGFFEGNLKDAMLRIRKDIQWGSIISWLNDNKVLQLVGTSYNNFEEQKKYAEILKEYLVWRQ